MKTSDKLLLGFFLLVLIIFTGVQATLYAKYKNGKILSGKEMIDRQFSTYRLAVPGNLLIHGFQWVTIVPSDSFYFHAARDGRPLTKQPYNWLADTLEITGDGLMKRNGAGYLGSESGYWELIVYCPSIKQIRLVSTDVNLVGNFLPHGNDYRFSLLDAHLRMGSFNYPDTLRHQQYFHYLQVNADSSALYLNENAHIDSAMLFMDKKSIVNDNGASLHSIEVRCPEKTNINLTARNFEKLKLLTE